MDLKNIDSHDRLVDPPKDDSRDKRYDAIDLDGIGLPGSRIFGGDIMVNKQSPANATEHTFTGSEATVNYRPSPLSYKSPVGGYIDKVLLTSGETNSTLIKILMRQTRRPELGDKFSSRHGQKGVCGLIVNQEDMPFNDQGICPGASSTLFDRQHPYWLLSYRHHYEPTWIPLANDSREDDRIASWEGLLI